MEEIYSNAFLDQIPWDVKQPPKQLVELIESEKVVPCHTVDIGCGAGNYAIWLAAKGFQVTEINFSKKAVELARKQAEQENVNCSFIVADLTDKKFKAYTEFEFAYDWEVLHHVFPDEQKEIIRCCADNRQFIHNKILGVIRLTHNPIDDIMKMPFSGKAYKI